MATVERLEHEGVEGLRAGRFNWGVSTAAIVYRIGNTLIDTGPSNQWRAVRQFIREKHVDRVLITHHHEDHTGNAARIQRDTGPAVLAPRDGVQFMAKGFPIHAYQRVVWGTPQRFQPEVLPDEIPVGDGAVLHVIAAPGHSVDMVCFLEPRRGWLFTADLFVASKARYFRDDEDLHQQIRSLHRLLQYDFNTVFCAHRGAVADGRKAIQDKYAYLECLRDQARNLHEQGASVREITSRLLGEEDMMTRITRGHYSKSNMIEACLAPED